MTTLTEITLILTNALVTLSLLRQAEEEHLAELRNITANPKNVAVNLYEKNLIWQNSVRIRTEEKSRLFDELHSRRDEATWPTYPISETSQVLAARNISNSPLPDDCLDPGKRLYMTKGPYSRAGKWQEDTVKDVMERTEGKAKSFQYIKEGSGHQCYEHDFNNTTMHNSLLGTEGMH